jgi:hypothetical protein
LHQNETHSHSWFINFDKNFKGPIPLWFHRWWQVHGPINEIIPKEVQEAIKYFSTVKKLTQQEAQLPITLHFFAHYKVSWIVKWQYTMSQNSQNCIARQLSVKWWDKFDFSRIRSRLDIEFPFKPEVTYSIQVRAPVAQLQPPEPSQVPKSESPISSKGKRPAKKDFKAFALALAEQFYEVSEEEEEEEGTAESSIHHYGEEGTIESFIRRYGFDPFQDAQDPYDAYDLNIDY